MAPTLTPLYRLLTPLLHHVSPKALLSPSLLLSTRAFSTSPPLQARPDAKKRNNIDPRITLIRYHLQHPKTPRPLKLSRMRGLRHWTIHRAWMLMRRKRIESEQGELYRLVFPYTNFKIPISARIYSYMGRYWEYMLV